MDRPEEPTLEWSLTVRLALASPSAESPRCALLSRSDFAAVREAARAEGLCGDDDEGEGKEARADEVLCIAVRRTEGRSRPLWKPREEGQAALICHVRAADATAPDGVLRLPADLQMHLAASYATGTKARAAITLHAPLTLDTVVLQPTHATTAAASVADLALALAASPHPAIIRQADTWMDRTTPVEQASYRVLMTSPVAQGIVVRNRTKVVLVPYTDGGAHNVNGTGGVASSNSQSPRATASVASRTSHRSILDEFDPDAFLSAALELGEDFDGVEDREVQPNGLDEADHASLSASSGSLTPRPFRDSPVVDGERWQLQNEVREEGPVGVGDDEAPSRSGRHGMRLTAVVMRSRPGLIMDNNGSPLVDAEGFLPDDETMCWLSVADLARCGVFADDWVLLRSVHDPQGRSGRLAQVKVDPTLGAEEDDSEVPDHAILLPPALLHNLFEGREDFQSTLAVILTPIPSGHRMVDLPNATTLTLARIASSHSTNKRYEGVFNGALRDFFESRDGKRRRVLRRGDVIAVAVPELGDAADEDDETTSVAPAHLVYFLVTDMNYDPLVPLEQDFESSMSSQARAGELGCWVDPQKVKMATHGLRHAVGFRGDQSYWSIPSPPTPYDTDADRRLRSLMQLMTSPHASAFAIQSSLLVVGAAGSGKSTLVSHAARQTGLHIVQADCFDLLSDTDVKTLGAFEAVIAKAKACTPCVLLLRNVDALGRKVSAQEHGVEPTLASRLAALPADLQAASVQTGWPAVLIGTAVDEDVLSQSTRNAFKQTVKLGAPNERQRALILAHKLARYRLAPDVDLQSLAKQTAALQAGDLDALISRGVEAALERLLDSHAERDASATLQQATAAGLSLSSDDLDSALLTARMSFSDSIGAPKIPNVTWDDVGGLASVKADILDTVQLPLQRPELFADGLKKRSGILLYGPPGTGKTLLAKAVATSCSLNFFSVKGPELLNMYIGESEANVRKVFQRARDAQPCVIFMDELDSIAPKRGNQGDSGGVMDRIVSQLLAELDGMSGGKGGDGVFVMAATNRPDLLDPALLRPGRFDRMLYLSVATEHDTQLKIMQALTRKFNLHPDLDLRAVAEACPLHLTGADFYALCSDALLKAMIRTAEGVDCKIASLNAEAGSRDVPLTPQYYLATMALPHEIEVQVTQADFQAAQRELVPSVSASEMEHYASVQQQFASETINAPEQKGIETQGNGSHAAEQVYAQSSHGKGKGKGKARAE